MCSKLEEDQRDGPLHHSIDSRQYSTPRPARTAGSSYRRVNMKISPSGECLLQTRNKFDKLSYKSQNEAESTITLKLSVLVDPTTKPNLPSG